MTPFRSTLRQLTLTSVGATKIEKIGFEPCGTLPEHLTVPYGPQRGSNVKLESFNNACGAPYGTLTDLLRAPAQEHSRRMLEIKDSHA